MSEGGSLLGAVSGGNIELPTILQRFRADTSHLMSSVGDFQLFGTRVGGVMSSVGASMTKFVTLPLIGIGVEAIHGAEKIEAAYRTIERATGAEGAKLQGLKKDFDAVYSKVPQDAGTVAQAIDSLNIKLGLQGKTLDVVATKYLQLGQLAGEALNPDSLANFVNRFHVPIDQIDSLLEKLHTLATKTKELPNAALTTAVTLQPTLGAQFNFNPDQILSIIGSANKQGFNANQMKMGLTRIFMQASKSGQDPRTLLDDLVGAVKRDPQAMRAFAMEAAKAIKLQPTGDPTKDLLADISKMLGPRAAPMFIEMAKSGVLSGDTSVLKGGPSIKDAIAQTQSFSETVKILSHNFDELLKPMGLFLVQWGTRIGKDVLPVLHEIGDFFKNLPSPVKSTIGAIVGIGAVLGPVLLLAGKLYQMFTNMAATIWKIATAPLRKLGILDTAEQKAATAAAEEQAAASDAAAEAKARQGEAAAGAATEEDGLASSEQAATTAAEEQGTAAATASGEVEGQGVAAATATPEIEGLAVADGEAGTAATTAATEQQAATTAAEEQGAAAAAATPEIDAFATAEAAAGTAGAGAAGGAGAGGAVAAGEGAAGGAAARGGAIGLAGRGVGAVIGGGAASAALTVPVIAMATMQGGDDPVVTKAKDDRFRKAHGGESQADLRYRKFAEADPEKALRELGPEPGPKDKDLAQWKHYKAILDDVWATHVRDTAALTDESRAFDGLEPKVQDLRQAQLDGAEAAQQHGAALRYLASQHDALMTFLSTSKWRDSNAAASAWGRGVTDAMDRVKTTQEGLDKLDWSGFNKAMTDGLTKMLDPIQTLSEKGSESLDGFIKNLQGHMNDVIDWQKNLGRLFAEGRGDVAVQLEKMGPQAAGLVKQAVGASDAEMQKLRSAFALDATMAGGAYTANFELAMQLLPVIAAAKGKLTAEQIAAGMGNPEAAGAIGEIAKEYGFKLANGVQSGIDSAGTLHIDLTSGGQQSGSRAEGGPDQPPGLPPGFNMPPPGPILVPPGFNMTRPAGHFAAGGNFTPGPIVVGEHGTEALWPNFSGSVTPHSGLQDLMRTTAAAAAHAGRTLGGGAPVAPEFSQRLIKGLTAELKRTMRPVQVDMHGTDQSGYALGYELGWALK